jgi:sugar/nucleoside kinase (ribokinase family)
LITKIDKKQIAVIGHLVWDRIIRPDGEVIEAFGGTAYNLAALSSVSKGKTTIFPVCYIGNDLAAEAAQYFYQMPSLDLSCLKMISRPTETHQLTYRADGYRKEDNRHNMPVYTKSLFAGCPKFDLALVNYIGGDEFPPRLLAWFKAKYKPIIYLDFHSLALGRAADNHRYFRYHPHWHKYTALADYVQMNDYELKSLFPGCTNSLETILGATKQVLITGPKAVIITREDKDLVVMWRDKRKIASKTIKVPHLGRAVDPTGCGDSFAAGFVNSISRQNDILRACRAGLAIASQKATFSGLEGYFKQI